MNAKFNYEWPHGDGNLALRKTQVMKKTTTNHEILLFTGNSFCHRQISWLEENATGKKLSPLEELEKACWSGLLFEIFPELSPSFSATCESFIWHVLTGKNYLHISIGPNPVAIENNTSLDPYYFSMSVCEN